MNRITVATVFGLMAAVPAAAAGVFFSTAPAATPCLAEPSGTSLRITDKVADFTVRIDNAATSPSLRLQLVDDPAIADFVLVDDGVTACPPDAKARSVRIDPDAATPDLIIALSHEPADKKIYVRSTQFSAQQAAALFAVTSGARAVTAHGIAR